MNGVDAARKRLDLSEFESLMVVKPSSLGDVVHALPAVAALREGAPHLKIRWLVNSEWVPVIDGSVVVDEVVEFPRREFRGLRGVGAYGQWLRGWRRGGAERRERELVIDFQGLLRSGLTSWARRGEWVVGMSDSREGASLFHDMVVKVGAGTHAVERYLAVAEACGMGWEVGGVRFPLAAGRAPKVELPEWFVVVHPYARGRGKALSRAQQLTLLGALGETPTVVVGRSEDGPVLRAANVVDLTNQTDLRELIWLLGRARRVISVDSGPMHLAAAVNDRVLGIHTWTDPRKVGPYPATAMVWKAGRIARRSELTAEENETAAVCERPDLEAIAEWAVAAV